MKNTLAAIVAIASLSAPAFAGEFGVVNNYGTSWRHGHGTQTVDQKINSQLTENGHTAAIKVVKSSFKGTDGYSDTAVAITATTGSSHFNETNQTKVRAEERYTFGSSNFTHATGSYFN